METKNLPKTVEVHGRYKRSWPDHIIFVSIGEFYETYGNDAKIVSNVCKTYLAERYYGYLTGFTKNRYNECAAALKKAGYKNLMTLEKASEQENKVSTNKQASNMEILRKSILTNLSTSVRTIRTQTITTIGSTM